VVKDRCRETLLDRRSVDQHGRTLALRSDVVELLLEMGRRGSARWAGVTILRFSRRSGTLSSSGRGELAGNDLARYVRNAECWPSHTCDLGLQLVDTIEGSRPHLVQTTPSMMTMHRVINTTANQVGLIIELPTCSIPASTARTHFCDHLTPL
jgi:hypothetical protein